MHICRLAKFALITLIPTIQATTVARITCGGIGGTDAIGNIWSADTAFTGGTKWDSNNQPSLSQQPIPYQTLRYSSGPVPFTYTIPVFPGSYTVTLKFLEPNKTAPGQRIFNVTINGTVVVANFDIFQIAPGALNSHDLTFPVPAPTGQIVITFKAAAGNAVISAIKIDSVDPVNPNPWTECPFVDPVTVPTPAINTTRLFCNAGSAGQLYRKDSDGSFQIVQVVANGQPILEELESCAIPPTPGSDCTGLYRATISLVDGTKLLLVGPESPPITTGPWVPVK